MSTSLETVLQVLTYQRRIAMRSVPDLQVVIFAFQGSTLGLQVKDISEINPDQITKLGRNDAGARDVGRVL